MIWYTVRVVLSTPCTNMYLCLSRVIVTDQIPAGYPCPTESEILHWFKHQVCSFTPKQIELIFDLYDLHEKANGGKKYLGLVYFKEEDKAKLEQV